MKTTTKLIWLELIGGILGWTWILASAAAMYFFVVALFFDSPWSRFLWALGIGAIAKWLARGFRDSQQRVAFEAELMAKGYSREEAGKEWLNRYSGTKP